MKLMLDGVVVLPKFLVAGERGCGRWMRSGANGAEPATTTNCGDRVRQMPRKMPGEN